MQQQSERQRIQVTKEAGWIFLALDVIQIKRLSWLGHLEKMKEDNWVRKHRKLISPGAKPRGRQKKTSKIFFLE